jgi:hypothetical protein
MRSQLRYVDQDQSGNIRAGRTVELFNFGTTTPISNSLYASATSMVALNPSTLLTDVLGEIEVWIDGYSPPITIRIGGASGVSETAYFEPDATAPWQSAKLFPYTDLTWAKIQRQVINAKDWGVLADGSDCTAAINAIFSTYRNGGFSPGFGLDLYFPPGLYSVGKIDATFLNNVTIRGVHLGTEFFADRQSSPGAVWDFTGSSDLYVADICVAGAQYGSAVAPTHIPTVWFLISESSTGGVSDQNSNANVFKNLGGYGYCSIAPVYLNNTVDTTFIWGHPNQYTTGVPNLWITSGNVGAVTSAFRTVNNTKTVMANITFLNWGGQGLRIDDNAANINFFGGNFDGTTYGQCVYLNGTVTKIGMYNCQFTSQTPLPNGGVFNIGNGTYYGLAIENCWFPSVVSGTVAVIKADAAALFKSLRITGLTAAELGGAGVCKIINHTNAAPTSTVVIDGGFLDCGDNDLAPGGTIKGVIASNVGTFTRAAGADETDCLFIEPGSYPAGGSGITLQNSAIRVGNGVAGSPTIGFTGDTGYDTGFYRSAENSIGVTANGSGVLVMSNAGLTMQNNQPIAPAAVSGTPPANTLFNDNLVKAWAVGNMNGTLAASFNVTSVTDNGLGDASFTWSQAFSSTNYAIIATAQTDSAIFCHSNDSSKSTTVGRVIARLSSTGAAADPTQINVMCLGLQ